MNKEIKITEDKETMGYLYLCVEYTNSNGSKCKFYDNGDLAREEHKKLMAKNTVKIDSSRALDTQVSF